MFHATHRHFSDEVLTRSAHPITMKLLATFTATMVAVAIAAPVLLSSSSVQKGSETSDSDADVMLGGVSALFPLSPATTC
jgi:hypothetical protein